MISDLRNYCQPRDVLYFCIYSVLIVGLYYSTLSFLFYQLKIWEDYNYGYLIPFIVLYLIWEKRDQLQSTSAKFSYAGLLFSVLGLGLFWFGELGGELFMQYLSLWMVISGLIWIHLGWTKFKIILFPVAFLLAMFPLPRFVTAKLTLKLKLISSKLGVMVLQAFGYTAYREGNIIDLGFTQLQVVDACSGLRYLIPLIVLSIVVVYFYKSAWWKKVLVIISAVPISIGINGMRIATVGFLYPIWGPKVAEGFFHDFSGWLIFMISLGILLGEIWILNFLFKEKKHQVGPQVSDGEGAQKDLDHTEGSSEKIVDDPEAQAPIKLFSPHVVIAIGLLVISIVLGNTVDFREKTVISKSFNQFPQQIGVWSGRRQQMEDKFIQALHLSDYTMIDYANTGGKSVNFYVAYYESQQKAESIHSPSTCLPAGGWVFNQAGKVRVSLSNGKAMVVNRAVMQKSGTRQLSYYWFPMHGRVLTNAYEMKLYNFWDALTRQRTDGALVRLITPLYSDELVASAEARLQAFMGDVVPVLDEFLPQ